MKYVVTKVSEWGFEYSIHCKKECDDDDRKLSEILADSQIEKYVCLGDFVYFKSKEDVTLFMLKWS